MDASSVASDLLAVGADDLGSVNYVETYGEAAALHPPLEVENSKHRMPCGQGILSFTPDVPDPTVSIKA
jgi:hypothetical protein